MTTTRQIAAAKHAAYVACQKAGLLRNGRLRGSVKHVDKRKDALRRACRNKM